MNVPRGSNWDAMMRSVWRREAGCGGFQGSAKETSSTAHGFGSKLLSIL